MTDTVIMSALIVSFANFVTIHVLSCASFVGRAPLWQAGLALFVPPLAPVIAARLKSTQLAVGWTVAALLYAVCLVRAVH